MDISLASVRTLRQIPRMFRTWPWWITFLLIAASLGWFWLLSHDLAFTRVEQGKAPAASQAKP